jgi:hypothetical protein
MPQCLRTRVTVATVMQETTADTPGRGPHFTSPRLACPTSRPASALSAQTRVLRVLALT